MQKSKISEMRNGWVEQSRGAVAGAQAVGVKFRRRMGRSLVTHYAGVSPAVDLQAFSVVEFKKISNGFCSRRLKLEALESVFAAILGK